SDRATGPGATPERASGATGAGSPGAGPYARHTPIGLARLAAPRPGPAARRAGPAGESADAAHDAAAGSRRLGVTLAIVLFAQLMIILDMTVVNIALPSIARGLQLPAAGLSWVMNAYSLTFGGLLLLGGRTGDLLGRRRVFLAGIGLFTVASLAGGLA